MSSEPVSEKSESTEKYREILNSNGILDPVDEILVKDPGLRAQGGGSDRRYVTVTFQNSTRPPLQMFSKVEVTANPSHMEIARGVKAFEKETIFLTKYVPAAKELLQRKGLDVDFYTNIYPKCYYGDESMLVLENLVLDKGYEIVGMQERHGWDVATICLESLAKHHALSHAMIKESGGTEQFFQKYPPLGHDGFSQKIWACRMESWMQGAWQANRKMLELNKDVAGVDEALEILKKLGSKKESLSELWRSALLTEDDEFQLLDHGDPWYTNMMFLKDPSTGKLVGHKLIDFQMLRYNSPAVDLGYYLLTSVKTDVRQSRFQDLLKFYLDCLKKLSTELGYPIEMSYDSLVLQFRKKYYYGLMNSFTMNYGPSIRIAHEADILTDVDFADQGTAMEKMSEIWVARNSEEARKLSEELVSLLKELNGYELQD